MHVVGGLPGTYLGGQRMTIQRPLMQGVTAFALACLLLPWQAYADGSAWTISELSGVVRYQAAAARGTQTWRSAAAGESLPSPFVVETGNNGHAVLGNGSDVMTINESSRVEISIDVTDRLTKAVQSLGNLLYQVLPGKMRRFEVHTPYLVSVVKGTTFTVQVTDEYATVSLLEGLVDVFATDQMNKRHEEQIHPGEVAIFGQGKTDIQVLEPSSQMIEPSLPMEENLKRLNEALKDLEPVAVEVVKLPVNTGRTDTGTVKADVAADVNAVEAESAGTAEQPRLPDMRDKMDRGERDKSGGVAVVAPSRVGVDEDVRTKPDVDLRTKPDVDNVRSDPVGSIDPGGDVEPPVTDPPDDNVNDDHVTNEPFDDNQGEDGNSQGEDGNSQGEDGNSQG